MDPLEARSKYVMKGVALYHPVTIERGANAKLYDVNGKEYIDFTSGIGVANLGHANPELIKAAEEQLKKLWHMCFMVVNYKPYVELAERLAKIAPGSSEKMVLLQNSGSEAIENAIKVAKQVTGRPYVVAYENSFHGRGTYGYALASTGKYKPYKTGFDPLIPGVELIPYPYCYRCPFKQEYPSCGLACLDYVKNWFSHTRVPPERVAAFIIEMVQGEGGFVVAPRDYVKELKSFLEANSILLIDDEVQAGWGRTGKMWAVEHFGIEPDIIATAKAIANGLPLSAVIGKREIMENTSPGSFGGTYGGNPVACSVAIKVVEIMQRDRIPERAAKLGDIMRKRLEEMFEKYELIGDVRGLGAMQAIELVRDRRSKEPAADETMRVINKAREKGLLLLRAGVYLNVIRLHPPLTIEEDNLMRGLDILEESIREVVS
ncbi:aspartate aminotransferase family protein [Candidatus Korarchaeum cryptofilum]|uniref:Ornithine aminotransferase n=1 Tax=Korarchaeum cryptofilum (strain OPF8) TaxID=374847 RepID=B1L472_KORCO|nr:aspartate aminotransferase family protein [Candidatus Korarchaeum cryptofilum]ACB07251.1 4-aminobutyrate aminotransferase [Candidatus Korarchaeum cryptofilum OPF8]